MGRKYLFFIFDNHLTQYPPNKLVIEGLSSFSSITLPLAIQNNYSIDLKYPIY